MNDVPWNDILLIIGGITAIIILALCDSRRRRKINQKKHLRHHIE